jgi:hypothetical protein
MGGRYTYDLGELEGLASGLERLAERYESSRGDYEDVAAAVGSPHVRSALDDFTDNWKKKRAKQTSMLRSAAAAVKRIATGYQDNDSEAGDGLRASS